MKIFHRVTFHYKSGVKKIFDREGIKYETVELFGDDDFLLILDIDESDPNWNMVDRLIKRHNGSDIFNTVHTEKEILSADWARIIPLYEVGIPDYLERPDFCKKCGIYNGSPPRFRIKNDLAQDGIHFLSFWGTYVLLAQSTVFSELKIHQITGYDKIDVAREKTDDISTIISQFHVPQIIQEKIDIDKSLMKSKKCSLCRRLKYLPHNHGQMIFKGTKEFSKTDISLTSEWFGDGVAAYREIIVSNRFIKIAMDHKWQGIRFKPIKVLS